MSLNKIFDEFNELYGIESKSIGHNLESMVELINDEVEEMSNEVVVHGSDNKRHLVSDINHHDFVKECIDVIYITCQQLRERGVNIDSALKEVHRSNMSKYSTAQDIDEQIEIARSSIIEDLSYKEVNGKFVIKSKERGKVIKPTTYSKAIITNKMIGK